MNINMKKTIILCLEGPAGTGKTTIFKNLGKKNYSLIKENFDKNKFTKIHPQSVIGESNWASNWFYLVEQHIISNNKTNLFISDRSPLSSLFYVRNDKVRNPLKFIIKESIKEFEKKYNVIIKTVYLKTKRKLLFKRVKERLKKEPNRKNYGEDDLKLMNQIYDYYESYKEWNFTIENNFEDLKKNKGLNLIQHLIQKQKMV